MTIQELLRKIANTDDLPSRWRVQAQKLWTVEGGQEPKDRQEVVLEYADPDDPDEAHPAYVRLGEIETSSPLVHTSDWISRILVDERVPAGILFPFEKALGSSHRHILALEGTPSEGPA